MVVGALTVILCSMCSFLYLNHQDTVSATLESEHLIVRAMENDHGLIAWFAMAVKSLVGIV
jgi:hypothetical protein